MKHNTLDELMRRYDEAEERRETEGSDSHVPPRYIVRLVPEVVTAERLTLADRVLLSRLPRCYEWTVVPGPDEPQ